MAIDLELTGGTHTLNSICQIGVILLDKRFNMTKTFESLVRPLDDYREPESMAIHGIPESELQKAPPLGDVLAQVEGLMPNPHSYTPSAWGMDIPYLRKQYDRIGRVWPFPNRIFELKSAASWELAKRDAGSFRGIEDILKQLGLSFEGKPHSALSDIFNSIRILKFLENGKIPPFTWRMGEVLTEETDHV